MKKALFLLASLLAASCVITPQPQAAESTNRWFTCNLPVGWTQIVPAPGTPTNVRHPLMSLTNPHTGAVIIGDAFDAGDYTLEAVAADVYAKTNKQGVLCTPITDSVNRSIFKITFYRDTGEIWSGRVVIMRLPGTTPNIVFIAQGFWPDGYSIESAIDFNTIISSAAIK